MSLPKNKRIEFEVSPELIEKAKRRVGFLDTETYRNLHELAKLMFLYVSVDEYVQDWTAKAACSKGCAWCCKIPVEITSVEARYIERLTGATPVPKKMRQKMPAKATDFDYCPFLNRDNNECRVYKARPFNCRSFFSFDDPIHCKNGDPHYTTGGPVNGFGSQYVFLLAKELIQVQIGRVPGFVEGTLDRKTANKMKVKLEKRVHDIREIFGTKPYVG